MHALQSNLSLTQPLNTSPSNYNASADIALLLREAMKSEKRQQNVIICNLPDNDSFVRDKHMQYDLFLDLKCNDIMIQSITRFGRQTSKLRPFHIELRSQQDVLTLLKTAPKLASLRNIWHNTSMFLDHSVAELEIDRKLTKELHQRREKGENLCLIDGKLASVIPHTSYSSASQVTINQSRVTVTEAKDTTRLYIINCKFTAPYFYLWRSAL